MHESALAETIAAALRDHAGWVHGRILIADPSFAHSSEALRLHLQAQGVDPDPADLEIVMMPVPAVCTRCGRRVDVVCLDDACSRCDGPLIPIGSRATVTLDLSAPV